MALTLHGHTLQYRDCLVAPSPQTHTTVQRLSGGPLPTDTHYRADNNQPFTQQMGRTPHSLPRELLVSVSSVQHSLSEGCFVTVADCFSLVCLSWLSCPEGPCGALQSLQCQTTSLTALKRAHLLYQSARSLKHNQLHQYTTEHW